MGDRPDWRISSLIRGSIEGFEKHTERIGRILDAAQEKFERDHTSTVGGFGIVVTLASLLLAFWKEMPVVSGLGVLGGIAAVVIALLVRSKSSENQVRYAQTMVDLERERARFRQRAAVLEHIWLHGLPEGTPLAQIQMLMGEDPSGTSDDHQEWKALPQAEDRDSHAPGQ